MKKIIGSKLYDTETAKCVGDYAFLTPKDSHYFTESLYRKETGEFFLYGKGKAMSKYGNVDNEHWAAGENIFPCLISEAKEWVLQHLSAEVYIGEFGRISE